jgi:hypothetical protein
MKLPVFPGTAFRSEMTREYRDIQVNRRNQVVYSDYDGKRRVIRDIHIEIEFDNGELRMHVWPGTIQDGQIKYRDRFSQYLVSDRAKYRDID